MDDMDDLDVATDVAKGTAAHRLDSIARAPGQRAQSAATRGL
jgi:hypothetical protein